MATGRNRGGVSEAAAKAAPRHAQGFKVRASECKARVFRAALGPCAWLRQRVMDMAASRRSCANFLLESTHVRHQRCHLT